MKKRGRSVGKTKLSVFPPPPPHRKGRRRFYVARDYWGDLTDDGSNSWAVYDREHDATRDPEHPWPIAAFAYKKDALAFARMKSGWTLGGTR